MGATAGWIALYVVIGVVLVAVVVGIVGHVLVRRGIREPLVVRLIDRGSDQVVSAIRRPLTVAVLDEVADVLRTGSYTRNIAAALRENHDEIKRMIAEKIEQDPTTKRIGLLPFHDRLIDEVSETALRVTLALLLDPRTDELVSDTLRDNLAQIRAAVSDRHTEL